MTGTEDGDSNVVPFPRGQFEQNRVEALFEELPVRSAPYHRTCDHTRAGATVNAQDRRVHCRACKVELDPISVLAALASNRENLVFAGLRLRREVEHLTERLERLRKDETNAKARIRKARKSLDDLDALRAAASATYADSDRCIRIGGYRAWPELSEPQREVVVGYVRRIVEAYRGALLDEARTA